MKKNTSHILAGVAIILTALFSPVVLRGADVIPPSAPTGLIARVASCGQVDLSWNASTDEPGGSGLKAYIIHRNDWNDTTIGAARTTFSDTNYVGSSTTLTYTLIAMDYAGNQSPASNAETVTTPPCPISSNEQIIDDAYVKFGKAIATYGARTTIIYAKVNANWTLDTWLDVHDDDTGQTSRFLLHTSPGYYQIESDYVLTSATDLWTLSSDLSTAGGKVVVSQYKLNGSPPTSATLVSTKALGDNNSRARAMIRLQSGALMVVWNEESFNYRSGDLTTGYAYRSPTGAWSIKFPVTFPNSYGIVMSNIAVAQHPADGSIWTFVKRDSFNEISALHFTEIANDLVLDWIKTDYISNVADGDNGPEIEFPWLVAIADPTRNAIMLAYQSYRSQFVFIDPLYGSGNSIFLKEAPAAIAQIRADGSKTFLNFQTRMERCAQFGMSVLGDGTMWLSYQPINHQTLTWNEVYSSNYFGNSWSIPALTGLAYTNYNVASCGPGNPIDRLDKTQTAFLTPDRKVHSFMLTGSSAPAAPDTVPPTTSIISPVDGKTVSGVVTVQATASDNTGVAQVNLLVDGVVKATTTSAPYFFLWDTNAAGPGRHTLQTVARDVAANTGSSAVITVAVPDTAPPVAAITSPLNGSVLPRNTTVTITATATDNVGVTKVEFYLGGKLLAADPSSPYAVTWKVPAKSNVSYTIKVIAYDSAGNTASGVSVVTAN